MKNKISIGMVILSLISLFIIGCIDLNERTTTLTVYPNKTIAKDMIGDNKESNSILRYDNVTDITEDVRNNFSIILQDVNKSLMSNTSIPTPVIGSEYIIVSKK